jgi:putative transposase
MNLEKEFLYHIFNRGNNGEKIFYTQANYQFFMKKIDHHISPYADILAWCLMPNHFHLMIFVRKETYRSLSINQSLGKMLSSYARAINIQEDRKGSLFQQHTKSICLNSNQKITRSWHKTFGVNKINAWKDTQHYPKICLDYIHSNPMNAGLVINIKDWKWSSYHEIYGNKPGKCLVNLEILKMVVPL